MDVHALPEIVGSIIAPLMVKPLAFLIKENLAGLAEERLSINGTTRKMFFVTAPSALTMFSLQRMETNGRTTPGLILTAGDALEKMSYLLASPPSISALVP